MKWNWQQKDWPNFAWDNSNVVGYEEAYHDAAHLLCEKVKLLRSSEAQELTILSLTEEALSTSVIEGEKPYSPSVKTAVAQVLGVSQVPRKSKPAELGVAEMVVSSYQSRIFQLSEETLHAWHTSLMSGSSIRNIGKYRVGTSPMQIVSGRLDRPKIHFEAPSSLDVPEEMTRFVGWFNSSSPNGSAPVEAVTRAGIAHLYYESIHPYEDGNGRIGRAIALKALLQGAGDCPFFPLSPTILAHQNGYYEALEAANKCNEITSWLVWFANVVLAAQETAIARIDFMGDTRMLLRRVDGNLNHRQLRALRRLIREGPQGFVGGMSQRNYITVTKASAEDAEQDLAELVDKKALIKRGDDRYARYWLKLETDSGERICDGR